MVAGTTPKATRIGQGVQLDPNSLVVPVMRATLPSSPSNTQLDRMHRAQEA